MQTTSHELSERLRGLGFKGESELVWVDYINGPIRVSSVPEMAKSIPAYQFNELWEALPISILIDKNTWDLYMAKDGKETMVSYFCPMPDVKDNRRVFRDKNPIEALGLIAIYLLMGDYLSKGA